MVLKTAADSEPYKRSAPEMYFCGKGKATCIFLYAIVYSTSETVFSNIEIIFPLSASCVSFLRFLAVHKEYDLAL